jgi:hypothetical protein
MSNHPQADLEWYETGHINTTLCIARIAGLSEELIRDISIYCQIPDYHKFKLRYSAGTPIWGWMEGKGAEAKMIATLLHGFHGGDSTEVMRRQRIFSNIVRTQMKNKDVPWKIGFAVHALGDAYAHTYMDAEKGRCAYDYPLGHGLDFLFCVKPDYISQHPKLYFDYCADLYWALCGKPAEENFEFLAYVGGFKAILDSKHFQEQDVGSQEYIISDYIVTASRDETTHADMISAGDGLNYTDVINYLRELEQIVVDPDTDAVGLPAST